MQESPVCPICGASEWSSVETFVYARRDRPVRRLLPLVKRWQLLRWLARVLLLARPRRLTGRARLLSPHEARLRSVLYEVWFPGQNTVTLTTMYCGRCEFMTYLPRPSAEDIRAKYRYLSDLNPPATGPVNTPSPAPATVARAERVYRLCLKHLSTHPDGQSLSDLRVLDYGGGDGRLLQPFLREGHRCFLIDYHPHPLPGVVKLADDWTTCRDDRRYDVIICSHVLEHVSDPGPTVEFLARRLARDGLLYVEVPQEIWGGLRLEADPVTHVNFFTPCALEYLLERNGLEVVASQTQVGDYEGATSEVFWALAALRRGGPALEIGAAPGEQDRLSEGVPHAGGDLRKLLYPSRRATLARLHRLSRRSVRRGKPKHDA